MPFLFKYCVQEFAFTGALNIKLNSACAGSPRGGGSYKAWPATRQQSGSIDQYNDVLRDIAKKGRVKELSSHPASPARFQAGHCRSRRKRRDKPT